MSSSNSWLPDLIKLKSFFTMKERLELKVGMEGRRKGRKERQTGLEEKKGWTEGWTGHGITDRF